MNCLIKSDKYITNGKNIFKRSKSKPNKKFLDNLKKYKEKLKKGEIK